MVGFYTVVIVSYCCLLPLAPIRSMSGLVLIVHCVSCSLLGLLVPAGHDGSRTLMKFATNLARFGLLYVFHRERLM